MKMEIIGPLLLSFLAGISTLLGGVLIFARFKNINNFIVFSLSFSISIMILISIFDLIPNSYVIIYNKYNNIGIIFSIIAFLFGYFTILLFNKIFNYDSSLYRVGVMSAISLMIHNFPEGIAVFMSGISNINVGLKLFLAIMLHNIPEGISIAIPIYYGNNSRKDALKITLISGLAEPVGALISYIFLKKYINLIFISFILLFVSGLMISLSINEIYAEIRKYTNNTFKYFGYLVGILIFILMNLFLK